jgi:methionine synthase II (cobalamin-independent)
MADATQVLFPTTLVGSMPQPDWLIDRQKLAGRFPPRVRARELWRVPPEYLQEAQDDATILAIRAQEEAGLDIVTDGEIRRESYSNLFANALEGVDLDNPGTALDRSGHEVPVPRVVGPIRRRHAVGVRDLEFLRRHTTRPVKVTVPGPVHDGAAGAGRSLRGQPAPRGPRTTRPPSTPKSATSFRQALMWCRSTSRTCRRGPTRRASSGSRH